MKYTTKDTTIIKGESIINDFESDLFQYLPFQNLPKDNFIYNNKSYSF